MVDFEQTALHPSVLVQLRLITGEGYIVTADHDMERQDRQAENDSQDWLWERVTYWQLIMKIRYIAYSEMSKNANPSMSCPSYVSHQWCSVFPFGSPSHSLVISRHWSISANHIQPWHDLCRWSLWRVWSLWHPVSFATMQPFPIVSLDYNSLQGTKTEWWRAFCIKSTSLFSCTYTVKDITVVKKIGHYKLC